MNISYSIEKLIAYAKIHLLLDEADEVYVRNAIMQRLGLDSFEAYEVDEEEIEGATSPAAYVGEIFDYAAEKGIASAENRKLFVAEIMDIVSLRPGEVEDMFESLPIGKALDFAYDYAVKNGSTDSVRRWENKGDNNIEVAFADCCGAGKQYPGCCRCYEGMGYGVRRNERMIPLPIGYYYRAARKALFEGMGEVIGEHKPMVVDAEALNVMFDFIELVPSRFIMTAETPASHYYFVCGNRALPVHKAGEKRKLKSKEYPYINIAETDWYVSTLKLSCTNREKLIEYALKLIDTHRKSGGKVFVSLRKADSKFILDLSFPKGENADMGLGKFDICAYAGVFRIDSATEAQLKTIEKYLTKELRFTPMCLTGGMEVHAAMIDKLLKEVGTSQLGAVEAALDVKEECKNTLVAALKSVGAYEKTDMAELFGLELHK